MSRERVQLIHTFGAEVIPVSHEQGGFIGAVELAEQFAMEQDHVFLPRQFDSPVGWELQNMLTVAQVIAQAALSRRESRGVHLRTDYPDTNLRLQGQRFAFSRTEAGGLEMRGGGMRVRG